MPLGSLEPGVREADSGFELCDSPRWRISSSRPPFLYLLKTSDVGVSPRPQVALFLVADFTRSAWAVSVTPLVSSTTHLSDLRELFIERLCKALSPVTFIVCSPSLFSLQKEKEGGYGKESGGKGRLENEEGRTRPVVRKQEDLEKASLLSPRVL